MAAHGFDISLSQFFIDSNRDVHSWWMFPDNHQFQKMKVPAPGTNIVVDGKLQSVTNKRPCFTISDLVLGSSSSSGAMTASSSVTPMMSKKFEWGTSTKRK